MGTELRFSTTFHPQTDGQSERTIQVLEDLLRSGVLDWQGSWEDHIAMTEFAYNNSFQSTIGMAPFEALYGRPCRSPSCWLDNKDPVLVGPELIEESVRIVDLIRKRMKEAQDRQKSYADLMRRPLEFVVGDHVFLKISPIRGVMQFGKSGKLTPRYFSDGVSQRAVIPCAMVSKPKLAASSQYLQDGVLALVVSYETCLARSHDSAYFLHASGHIQTAIRACTGHLEVIDHKTCDTLFASTMFSGCLSFGLL